MGKYISILRGINVGGRNKVLMNDLKTLFEKTGVQKVQNYIQSGNILFEAENLNITEFNLKIADAFQYEFGFSVPFITFSSKLIEKAINSNPFTTTYPIAQLHLTFLAENPTLENKEGLFKKDFTDEYEIIEKLFFIACKKQYSDTKLNNQFIEKHLKVTATTRNWKTVCKLHELSL